MIDKFFLSDTLKNRLGQPLVEKINKGFETDPTRMSIAKIHTHLTLAQNKNEPIYDAVHKAMPAACLITVFYEEPQKGTQQWTGSGFLIQPGIVVTSGHVLPLGPGENVIKISFDGDSQINARVGSYDKDTDIGTLYLNDIGINPAPIAPEEPTQGEQIAVIGAPEGWSNVVTIGYVSAIHQTPQVLPGESWQDMIFIDADIYEGSSGSMVVNVNGEVIGMVMGIIGKEAAEKSIGQNAVIPMHRILQSLS